MQPFLKMHGLGNDFVVLDRRAAAVRLTAAAARAIANRRLGVGCDQVISIESSAHADAFMRIHNADGSEVAACGNATRCVAHLMMQETGRTMVTVETAAGLLPCQAGNDGLISADMGEPRFDWRDIPLARPMDTLHLDYAAGPTGRDGLPLLRDPVAVNVGNPHVIFVVADADSVPLAELGPRIEHDPLFPERINVEAVQILGRDRLRLRVWERGAGITPACGSGACATLVGTARRGLTGRRADILLDGGTLTIDWRADNHIIMTGPVAVSFQGTLEPALLTPEPADAARRESAA